MTEEEFLRNYDSNKFFKPSVTVDSILFTIRDVETTNYRKLPEKKLQVLLVKRAEHPYLGKWCLPGTFVRKEERFEEAVQRSLKAKTNMQDIYLEQLYSWGEPSRDPRTRIISTSYMGLVDSERINIKSGGTTQDASWFTISLNTINEKTTENIHGYKKEEEIEIVLESQTEIIKKETKITDNLKNEDQKDYPAIGNYTINIKYQDQKLKKKVIVKDTTAPVFNEINEVSFEEGTENYDFNQEIKATDLSNIDLQYDLSSLDINKAGDYQIKVQEIKQKKK